MSLSIIQKARSSRNAARRAGSNSRKTRKGRKDSARTAEPKITDKRDCCEYWAISHEIDKMKTLCSIITKSDEKS